VDRNENDPRLWYYRFQTSAIGWNPGVNVLLPDDYRTSGRTYPVLYMFHGGNDDFRQFDFLGIRDLTAGKPIIVVMPDGGHAGWYSNPVTRSSARGTGRHSTSPSCSPGSRRISERTPSTTAVRSAGFRWVASVR
jgi:Predicted esterase